MNFFIFSLVAIALLPWLFILQRKFILEPDKPWATVILNVLLKPLRVLRLGPFKHKFEVASALRAAMKSTKVTNVGSDSRFLEDYNYILNSPSFTRLEFACLGYISASTELVEAFKRRLRGQEFLALHPDVLSVPLKRPIFVVGLPRTGTTFLHRLLSLDPSCRAPLTWELFSPYPLTNDSDLETIKVDRVKRRNHADKNIKQMENFGGYSLKAIHEIGTDLPEECLISLTNDLPVLFSLFNACFLEYLKFTEMNCDAAYTRHRQVLQTLSWQLGEGRIDGAGAAEAKRWVLKCPIHLMFMDSLAKVFPDAVIVYTHRTPSDAVSSLASLIRALHSSFYEPNTCDVIATGRASLDWAKYSYEKAMRDLDASRLQCVHVRYDDLIANPKNVLRNVLKQVNGNDALSEEFERNVDGFLEEDKAKRLRMKGVSKKLHIYNPVEFGLTKEMIEQEMTDYMKKFNF